MIALFDLWPLLVRPSGLVEFLLVTHTYAVGCILPPLARLQHSFFLAQHQARFIDEACCCDGGCARGKELALACHLGDDEGGEG